MRRLRLEEEGMMVEEEMLRTHIEGMTKAG